MTVCYHDASVHLTVVCRSMLGLVRGNQLFAMDSKLKGNSVLISIILFTQHKYYKTN